MEQAGRVVWRQCAAQWRVKRRCSAALLQPGAVTSKVSPVGGRSSPLAPLCSALTRAASLSRGFTTHRPLCTGGRPCWSCQSAVGSSELFCPSCSCIQPPSEGRDYFQLLHCERSFIIDVQDLQRKYRNLQRLLHPDYFSRKSQREREISEKQSSLVNKAYNTLLSPLSRGIYLLSLHGITIAEGTEDGMDAPFLIEVLELNEKLHDLSTEAEIEEIGTLVQEKCHSLIENVRKAFEKGDLDGAKMLLAKMKYYSNILDQVKKKMVP
ncbi:hypothetical protein GDO78_007259 [Eleutherodactylus coqui]|uniref:Iron-sulfur cluster co-chaperone protein HscB n=1 Tax=Eleutherodactylus coqui TaxID=57060 RepID=A0A8J6FGB6_ELECQ|nr:hypothetical protein GDO78_007259 [Eleutherodactylus coqui]